MASLTIKNISDELLGPLCEIAGRERGNITQQALHKFEQALTAERGTTIRAEGADDQTDDKERP